MRRGGALLVALGLAHGALAQTPLPSDVASDEDRERFRLCRAAIFIHLGEPDWPDGVLTREAVKAMDEQMGFAMSETVANAPNASVAEGRRVLDFWERFFISFSKTIGEAREQLADPAAREALLIDCQPLIWTIMRERIDFLMQWRQNALRDAGAPAVGMEDGHDGR
jgi:hypothetical protein